MSLASKLAGCVGRLSSPFAGERAAAEARIRAICARARLSPAAYGLDAETAKTGIIRAAAAARYLNWANCDASDGWRANGTDCWTCEAGPNVWGLSPLPLAVDDAMIVALAERDIGGAAEFDRWIAHGMRTPARYADAFRDGEPA